MFGLEKGNKDLIRLKYKIYTLKGLTQKEKAEHFKLGKNTLTSWGKLKENYPEIFAEKEEE
jgi:transposase